jgi:hypothetical protein
LAGAVFDAPFLGASSSSKKKSWSLTYKTSCIGRMTSRPPPAYLPEPPRSISRAGSEFQTYSANHKQPSRQPLRPYLSLSACCKTKNLSTRLRMRVIKEKY